MKAVKTPCVGVCSTVFGDEVCRGCKRFVHEVIDWNSYSNEQKLLVKARLSDLAHQVLVGKIEVIDQACFNDSLRLTKIDLEQTDANLLIEFLRKAAKQIQDLRDHGLRVFPEYEAYSANELKELIDKEIHILGTATYQKDFMSRKASAQGGQKDGMEKEMGSMQPTFYSNKSEVQI